MFYGKRCDGTRDPKAVGMAGREGREGRYQNRTRARRAWGSYLDCAPSVGYTRVRGSVLLS